MRSGNVDKIRRIFHQVEKDGRQFLLESEVYEILAESGIPPPEHVLVPTGRKIVSKDLSRIRSDSVVVKIVSPLILHKSDVGGVEVVRNRISSIQEIIDRMIQEVPGRYLEWLKKARESGSGRTSTSGSVRESIRGFLICEKVEFEDVGFGSEILAGVRNSRDFGPVMTIGCGGVDVEFMNERFKEGQSVSTSSVHLLPSEKILDVLEPLAFYGKLAAPFRGKGPLLLASELEKTIRRFREWASAFSSQSPDSPFVIEEAEVNPFVVRNGTLVPLDGFCRFSRAKEILAARPFEAIGHLLRPESIGIAGVSEKSMNIGRIILRNVLESGFPSEFVSIIKAGVDEIEGCRCYPAVEALPASVDLFVLTLAADRCEGMMRDIIDHEKARAVIIIAGGMGEKEGGGGIEENIRSLLAAGRRGKRLTPVVNGGNCLGIVSKPGRYDTTFIPEYKLPRTKGRETGLALISQSGAFMICRTSRLPGIEPRYAISLGNQLDLTVSDYLNYLRSDPAVTVFGVYMEGFRKADGLDFARAVGEITAGGDRTVIIYKAGRSPEGRAATSSHTASVAGEYSVCKAVIEQSGGLVARDIFEFESLIKGFVLLERKQVRGPGVGLISNAGFECVVLADNLRAGGPLELATLSPQTRGKIASALQPLGIDRLQDVHNPLDVTPVADDAVFCECARAILEDPGIDCAVVSNVPMTPAQQTLPPGRGHGEDFTREESFARRIVEIFESTEKPFVLNVDSGSLYDPLVRFLETSGIPVFRHADEAVRFLGTFVNHKLNVRRG